MKINACDYVTNVMLPHSQRENQLKASIAKTYDESAQVRTNDKNIMAQINAGSICVFNSGLTDQNKQDVSNSILFAQLASDNEFNRFSQSESWCEFFLNVLGNIGWNQSHFSFEKYDKPTVDWIDIVLDSMKNVATQDEMNLAKIGMESWKNLQSNSQGMMIWNKRTIQKNPIYGNNQIFQIIPFDAVSDGEVEIVIGAVYSQTTGEPDGFLIWREKNEINSSSTKLTLNEEIYATVRQEIIDKLGGKVKEFIVDLPVST